MKINTRTEDRRTHTVDMELTPEDLRKLIGELRHASDLYIMPRLERLLDHLEGLE